MKNELGSQRDHSLRIFLRRFIEKALSAPLVFDFQQKFCNNYTAVRDEFAEYLSTSGKRILDVGCSTGACARQVVDMEKNAYTGVDIEPQYIETATRLYPAGKFLALDARSLPFESGSFDLVLFTGVWHHMDDSLIKDCLREVGRVLADSGAVLVAEPVFTPGWALSNFLLSLDRGRYIRAEEDYRALVDGFAVARQRFFKLSFHRFCSFVLTKRAAS